MLLDVTSYGQKGKIFPGAMTMDHEDNLFMALFGGSKLLKVNTKWVFKYFWNFPKISTDFFLIQFRTHKVDQEIKLNIEQPTGVEFGGKHLDMLFVTSAAMGLTHEQTYPAGYLMKITNVGSMGLQMHKFVM